METKLKTVMDCIAEVAEDLSADDYLTLLERIRYEIDKQIECDL